VIEERVEADIDSEFPSRYHYRVAIDSKRRGEEPRNLSIKISDREVSRPLGGKERKKEERKGKNGRIVTSFNLHVPAAVFPALLAQLDFMRAHANNVNVGNCICPMIHASAET